MLKFPDKVKIVKKPRALLGTHALDQHEEETPRARVPRAPRARSHAWLIYVDVRTRPHVPTGYSSAGRHACAGCLRRRFHHRVRSVRTAGPGGCTEASGNSSKMSSSSGGGYRNATAGWVTDSGGSFAACGGEEKRGPACAGRAGAARNLPESAEKASSNGGT